MKGRVHFLGIGGVGMAGLAVLMKARGCRVSGCDCHDSARLGWLRGLGIEVSVGHDPAHIDGVERLIVTPAVHADEPELVAAEKAGVPVMRRGVALAGLVTAAADSIAVCGSHGKTTTSTWIARLLLALGERVAWCIGGETGSFPVAGCEGPADREPVLVVEADESDGTLAEYRAKTLVVNRCEYDHPDHFPTAADYFACFETAKAQAGDVVESEALPELDAGCLQTLPPHNRRNARAAVEVALRRGHVLADILARLPAVIAELPDRRFQPLAEGVYTDYAHHPTEMECAVAMARAVCRGTLRVLFQPHRYSRTRALIRDFPKSLRGADETVICPTYAAFEPPLEGGGSADLYAEIRRAFAEYGAEDGKSRRVYLARTCDEAWEHALNSAVPGDVTLLLGAGDIIGLVPKVKSGRPYPRRRQLIGAGSNTWKSDLRLAIEYVKTEGPAGRPGAELVRAHPRLLPWMAGIPGTVGGWIRMNAGAFGHSISEALEAVKVDGGWRSAADCGFGYRTSAISGEIGDYRLRPDPPEGAETGCDSVEGYLGRRHRFPPGTWGSFFKNPPGDSAGRLLEACGCKELRVGGAYVWREHANVIVRGEGATASDVLALASLMQERVRRVYGTMLEPEVAGISPLLSAGIFC